MCACFLHFLLIISQTIPFSHRSFSYVHRRKSLQAVHQHPYLNVATFKQTNKSIYVAQSILFAAFSGKFCQYFVWLTTPNDVLWSVRATVSDKPFLALTQNMFQNRKKKRKVLTLCAVVNVMYAITEKNKGKSNNENKQRQQ